MVGKHTVTSVVDEDTGEVVLEALEIVSDEAADRGPRSAASMAIEIIEDVDDPLVLNTLLEDTTESHEEALLKIYGRLRPGNPPQVEKAKELFREKFFDPTRYRLGRVGRFRLNRKFGTGLPRGASRPCTSRTWSTRCATS